MSDELLKKCPFCNSKAEPIWLNDVKRNAVMCKRCCATTGLYVEKEKAIAAWNMRARWIAWRLI